MKFLTSSKEKLCPTRQSLINITKKLARSGVDQNVDHEPQIGFTSNYVQKKKARVCGLFRWSECTDLNRGPLVPQNLADSSCECRRVSRSGSVYGFCGQRVSPTAATFWTCLAALVTIR